MQQVLFTIFGFSFPAFGAMLFVTFIIVTWWGTIRARRIGMPASKFQDFIIVIFVAGFVGARTLYMVQYANHFPDQSFLGLVAAFFKIWEGGIIFYGSALGGAIGYGFFYWFVMRKMNVSGWQLADAVAPLLALGLAIGRIGCYLNGCCWGQVACEEVCPVPLGAAHFPLLPGHMRSQLVAEQYLQTSTGFAIEPRNRGNPYADPRARVTVVEPGSPAAGAGLKPGDIIAGVNGEPNAILVDVTGPEDKVKAAVLKLKEHGATLATTPTGRDRASFPTLPQYLKGRMETEAEVSGVEMHATDRLDDLTRDWPRGRSRLTLSVERDGQAVELKSFAPATIGLYPTQLYETLSMALIILVLLAYYPYRRHDGQLFVLLMVAYAIHRFVNESIRIEPSYAFGLTLSQWGSVIVFLLAVVMEVILISIQPSRWRTAPPAGAEP